MTLAEHARKELEKCGQYAEDPEYSESIIRAVTEFTSYGHSGGSAEMAVKQLYDLLRFRTLSPITSDPAEWIDQSEISGTPLWQNNRDPRIFSEDGGKTWYSVEEKERTMPKRDIAEDFQQLARDTVYGYIIGHLDKSDAPISFTVENVYVVWFSKTLQNWKALVSSDLPDGMYYEVTYNGNTQEIYLDAYRKVDNVVIPKF